MKYVGLVCSLLAIIPRLHANEADFIEPVEEQLGVEFYEFEGERIAIYMQKVTWLQASQLCPARNGTLVEYETGGLAEFVARALAESAVGFGSLWIGGHLVQPDQAVDGVWKWANSSNVISPATGVTEFPMKTVPYWVDMPAVTSETKLCLGTDRRMHHLPLIISVDCEQKRPYICRLPSPTDSGTGVEVKPPVELGDKRFHIFYGQFTWSQALSRCLLIGMTLAKLTTSHQFYVIGNRMRRARPILENAWIGGAYTDGSWKWVSSSEAINVDQSNETSEEPFAWYRPNDIINDGCLLADRHVCDHFVYVEAKCDRKRSYICEEDLVKPPEPNWLIQVNGSDYWVSTFIETWHKAQNVCASCLGGELIHLKQTEAEVAVQLPFLFQAMAISANIEIRHVWIGGYLFDKEFKWTDSSYKEIAGAVPLTDKTFEGVHGIGDKGLLMYCKIDLSVDTFLFIYKCLNMDRENQKNFFVYGLTCDIKQFFICQAPSGAKLADACKSTNTNTGTGTGSVTIDENKAPKEEATTPPPPPPEP